MIIYRPHCGGTIANSIKQAVEFNNEQEMKEYIEEQWNGYISAEDVVIDNSKAENDDRIGWKDTRYVCTKRFGKDDCIKKYKCPQCIGYCATDYIK
jgi:hypothetical protein